MILSVCVYSSSSDAVDRIYFRAAEELGAALAKAGCNLVYGGSNIGLMGAVASAVHGSGGNVTGVIPAAIADHGIAYNMADELIVTDTLRERKRIMEERSDAFVALPGGFGTLEELLEIITLKQLHYHNKAVALLNVDDYYQPLIDLFEHLYSRSFAKADSRNAYEVCTDVPQLMAYLSTYKPPNLKEKWFHT